MARHPLYKTWFEMKQRCFNPAKHNYKHYGGRGITVCEKWMSFAAFVEDMGPRPDGHTLDRLDHNGNYEPANCQWATKLQQANNTRTNRMLFVDESMITLSEAARKYGVHFGTIWVRLKAGWPDDVAVKTPVRKHKAYKRTQCSNARAEGKAY